LGERLEFGHRNGKTERITELEKLIEALTRYKATSRPLQESSNPLNESSEQMYYLKKLWTALNTDITLHLQTIRNNILDIYDPQLVPVHSRGITVEWVSARTGERVWH
jgi:hypothetical protein